MLFEDHIDLFADLNISGQVKSIVSGVSPMVVTSRVLNINFNADLLDDKEGSYYLDFQNFTGRAAFSQLPQISPGLIGRYSTGTGDMQQITLGAGFSLPGGVLTYTETDPTVPGHVKGITSGNINNWNTAYTSLPNYVLKAGDSMSGNLRFSWGSGIQYGGGVSGTGGYIFGSNLSASGTAGYGVWMAHNAFLTSDGTFIQPRGTLRSTLFTVNNHRGIEFLSAASTGTHGGEITPVQLVVITASGQTTITNLSGTGNGIAGVASTGRLYRRPDSDFLQTLSLRSDSGGIAISGGNSVRLDSIYRKVVASGESVGTWTSNQTEGILPFAKSGSDDLGSSIGGFAFKRLTGASGSGSFGIYRENSYVAKLKYFIGTSASGDYTPYTFASEEWTVSNYYSKTESDGRYLSALTVNGENYLTIDSGSKTLTAGAINLNSTHTSGVLPVTKGGTGAGTLTGILVGNGTSPITSITGSSDQLLRRNTANTGYEFFTHDFISSTLIGANNGIAPLDASGKIPSGYLPVTGMQYKGTWDASTNTPTLSDATGQDGWYYRVTAAGTQNLGSGNITFSVGDDVIHNGVSWERAPSGVAATNLAVGTRTNTTLPITNSNGTGFSIPLATGSLAGIISGDDYTKLQNAITENQTITVSGAVNGSGTTSIVTTFRNSAALSVIGRSANSVGAPSDITAVTDGHVLRRSGTSLGFGLIGDNSISSLSWSKLSSVPTTLSGYGIQTEADNRYVNTTGDTMTGMLTVKSSIGYKLNLINTQDISSAVDLSFRNPTGDEWQIIAANTGNTTFGDVDFWVNSLLINGDPIATEDWVESKGYITSASIPPAQTLSFDSGTGSLSILSGNSVSLDDRYLSLKPSSHTLSNNASLDIDTITGTSILRIEPIVGGVPAGVVMTWNAGERKYQFHHSHFSGDSVFYRNQLTTAGGWRSWYQVASREWADSTFYTKTISDGRYVNTYGNQSGIVGNKTWTGGQIWAPGANFTPASAPATLAIGKSTSGIYLIAYDNDSNQAFALRTYTAAGGIQLTLDKGGISTPIHGDSAQWNTAYTMRHDAVTITGQNYLSLSGQQITAGAIALNSTHTSGVLPVSKGGTGISTLGTAGQMLKVNAGGTALEYFTPSYLTSVALGDITNVTLSSPTNGQVLTYNGSAWINSTPSYLPSSNKYVSVFNNGATTDVVGNLDFDNAPMSTILRAEPAVNSPEGAGLLYTFGDSGSRAFQMFQGHGFNDSFWYRTRLTVANGWRGWLQVASRDWVTSQNYALASAIPTNYVTTNTNQSSLGGNKAWTGSHSWALSSNVTPSVSASSIAVGKATSGLYLIAYDNDANQAFALRTYAASNYQLTLNKGGVETPNHGNSSQWNTAYSWGNHASAGYVPQTRTLQFTNGAGLTVSGTTSTDLSVNRTVTYSVNFGTTAGTVAQGNDSRINNGQTAYGWGNHASAGYVPQTRELTFGAGDGLSVSGTSSTNLSVNRNVNYNVNFGTGSNQVARGNHNHDGVYVPTSRTITINGVTQNLSDNRSWTISAGVTGSGSNGYIARWNSGTGITNSELYQSGGNIGIGTTSPVDKLTINGTLGVIGDAAVRGTALHVHNNLSIGKYDSVPGNRAHGRLLVHSGDTSTYAHESAALEIRSTTKALLLPRQSTTQWDNIGSKPEGLFSYDTTDKSIRWFTGTETIKLFANSLGFWVFVGGIYRRINFDL